MKPTAEQIRKLLLCDASTGRLIWRARSPELFSDDEGQTKEVRCDIWNSKYAGREAGHDAKNGYRTIRIFDHAYLVHHVIWLIVHGVWPRQLDHKNGKEVGDGIENLRLANQSQNNQNARKRANNRSGFKGVSWDAVNAKWVVRIRVPRGGKYENLGRFDDPAEGHRAYCNRAVELFGEFARFE